MQVFVLNARLPRTVSTALLLGSIAIAGRGQTAPTHIENGSLRVEVAGVGAVSEETISLKVGGQWVPALSATSSAMHVHLGAPDKTCAVVKVSVEGDGLLVNGACEGVGRYEQRVALTGKETIHVTTRVNAGGKDGVNSVEDKYDFVPALHPVKGPLDNPLDFVWSQNIKREVNDVVAINQFKSPAIMMQQGEVFTAIVPDVSDRLIKPLAMDMDVTSGKRPWMSYGAIPSEPHGHSYFHRVFDQQPRMVAHDVSYSYTITVSQEAPMLGYRRIVKDLWSEYGHDALVSSPELQQNTLRRNLMSFDSWREEAWHTYADSIFSDFDCGGKKCGTLATKRDLKSGGANNNKPDAWFNAWFQTLRTAYGWYLRGKATNDTVMMAKADSVLNLSLTAPQHEGAFPTVYSFVDKKWSPDDGWAGYAEDYHAFCMSWQAYWMLRWAVDLEPQRKPEVMRFLKPYADFLLKHQLASGVIPSWYGADLVPRTEFRDFNGETGASALFLAAFAEASGEKKYTAGAEKAMNFVTEQVVPRQKWFDFETYLSCAKKPYDFYDTWTAQFPQNNLAEIQTVQAWLLLYQTTHKKVYLDRGTAALDYLLLTQQVYNTPLFTPKLLGGFTTQNTDAEWSDARQAYVATLLFDYFRETGNFQYLERSVAAARSGFAVAPWENWAHNGRPDSPGAMTGFHWGTGSAMTSVEIMAPVMGDAYIDVGAGKGVGFNECSVTDVLVDGGRVQFRLASPDKKHDFVVHFAGVDAKASYRVSWNGGAEKKISGADLAKGLTVSAM